MALASSEKTVLAVNVYVELVGRAQMTNTDEIEVAPGSVFLARQLHSKKRGVSSKLVASRFYLVPSPGTQQYQDRGG